MDTDTMISLATDTHAQRLRDGERERTAGQASAHSRAGVRFTLGAALIATGRRLQGITESLPEPSFLPEPHVASPAGR